MAHVIGDFPLQTDTIYRLKKLSFLGVIPHVLICTAANIIILFPYWSSKYVWWAILLLGLIHALLDKTKLFISSRMAGDTLTNFMVDQLLHILTIWLVSYWLLHGAQLQSIIAAEQVYNRYAVISTIALLYAGYGGIPVLYYLNRFWASRLKKSESAQLEYPSLPKRLPGILERLVATSGIIIGGWFLLLLILAFIPRSVFYLAKGHTTSLVFNAFASLFLSTCCGLFALYFF